MSDRYLRKDLEKNYQVMRPAQKVWKSENTMMKNLSLLLRLFKVKLILKHLTKYFFKQKHSITYGEFYTST